MEGKRGTVGSGEGELLVECLRRIKRGQTDVNEYSIFAGSVEVGVGLPECLVDAVLETIFDLVVAILDVGLKELEHRVGDLALVEIGQVGLSECHERCSGSLPKLYT